MSRTLLEDALLVDRFVATFEKFDELTADEQFDPIAWQLSIGEPDKFGYKRWRPIRVSADPALLAPIYSGLPIRFPRLFELLLLSYRWAQVDLRIYSLFANPPGPDLAGFVEQMTRDTFLWKCLKREGYIQFGKGPHTNYDPVCFDIKSRRKNGDCRIVRIDHEEILCNDRVKVIEELAPSFEQLMLRTIDQVKKP
jgi:hypothetical protein